MRMPKPTPLLKLSVLLLTGIATTGCYRTVATIHVNEARQFVVERSEDATEDDEIPPVSETDEGQIVWVTDGYRVEVLVTNGPWTTRAENDDSPEAESLTQGLHGIRSPSNLSLDVDDALEIRTEGELYRFSLLHFERVEVNRLRSDATALAIVVGTSLGVVGVVAAVVLLYLLGSL